MSDTTLVYTYACRHTYDRSGNVTAGCGRGFTSEKRLSVCDRCGRDLMLIDIFQEIPLR